jgi:hypothetical protein
MRQLLTAAVVALLLIAGPLRATSDKPCDIDPLDCPTDTPWRCCLEEEPGCEPWYHDWCGTPPRHAPEPSALALLALGAVGLVVARRHGRKAA